MENIGRYFEIVNNIWFLAITFITAFCYYYLAKQFLKEVKLVWLVGVVYFLSMTVLYYVPFWEISNFSAYAFGVISGLLVMCLFRKRKGRSENFSICYFFFSALVISGHGGYWAMR